LNGIGLETGKYRRNLNLSSIRGPQASVGLPSGKAKKFSKVA
jgi:hypothetical protein